MEITGADTLSMTRFSLDELEDEDWSFWQSLRNSYRSRPEHQIQDSVESEIKQIGRRSPYLKPGTITAGHLSLYHDIGTNPIAVRARLNVRREWKKMGIWRSRFEKLMKGGIKDVRGWAPENQDMQGDELRAHMDKNRSINTFLLQMREAKTALGNPADKRSRSSTGTDLIRSDWEAYWSVKREWERRAICPSVWQSLPGNLWPHESSFDERASSEDTCHIGAETQREPFLEKVDVATVTRYRRRIRKVKRRVQWVRSQDDLDVQKDGKQSAEFPEHSQQWRQKASAQLWLEHAAFKAAKDESSLGVSTTQTLQTPSDRNTSVGPADHNQPSIDCRHNFSDGSGTVDIAMCLGYDCAAHSSISWEWENVRTCAQEKRNCSMPGSFPGDLELYLDLEA